MVGEEVRRWSVHSARSARRERAHKCDGHHAAKDGKVTHPRSPRPKGSSYRSTWSPRHRSRRSPVKEFTLNLSAWLWLIFTLPAVLGCAYALFAAALLRRFPQESSNSPQWRPNVTVLKPLCGAEPELETNLASFCNQDGTGRVQVIFGIQDAADRAAAVVHRLIERFPEHDI